MMIFFLGGALFECSFLTVLVRVPEVLDSASHLVICPILNVFFVFLNWSRLSRPLSFLFVCLKYPSSKHFFSTQSI